MIDYGLKDKVAVITGTNNPQGIGAATALAFAREGAKVVLVYKRVFHSFDILNTNRNGLDRYYAANAGDAVDTAARLEEMQAECLILERDITHEDAVQDIFAKIMTRFGRVDVLVNNASTNDEDGLDTIQKISPDVIDSTFAVNVRGTLLMTREFVLHCGNTGRIINLSSDAAQIFPTQITYGASKAAVEALTRSLALEVGQFGITVNCVAPGPTQSGWIDEERENTVVPQIPMGELVQPEDVAETILFLSSTQARMITGQVIKVSGGHAL